MRLFFMYSFVEFFQSDIDYLLVVGPKGSGRSSLMEQIKKDYLSSFPLAKGYENTYINIYQYGSYIYNEATLSDLGNYNEHDYSSKRDGVMPLTVIGQLDDMNEYEKKIFLQYMVYSNRDEAMRFKLIITATKETVEELGLDKEEHMTIYIEDKHVNQIEMLQKDIEHMYNYPKFTKEQIDMINASIIFGEGLISEYSFTHAFKNKKENPFSLDAKELLDYLRYNSSIYNFYEDDDLRFCYRFIWYKHHHIYIYLKELLKEKIKEAGRAYYLLFSNINYSDEDYRYSFNPKLALKGMFFLDENKLKIILENASTRQLCLDSGGFTTLEEVYKEEFIRNPLLSETILKIMSEELRVGRYVDRLLSIAYDGIIPVYMDLDNKAYLIEFIDKTFIAIKEYLDNKDNIGKTIYEKCVPLAEMYYINNPTKDNKAYLVSLILKAMPEDDGSSVFYEKLVTLTTYLKNIGAVEAQSYIDRYFTFSSSEELLHFVISALHRPSLLGEVQQLAVIKTK